MTPQTEIEILKLEKNLAELDLKWYKKEGTFKIHAKYSSYFPTTENIQVQFGLIILAFICVLLFYFVSLMTNTDLIIAIIILLAFTIDGYFGYKKACYYEQEKEIYLSQKEILTQQILKLKEHFE